jgi:hypothetical protein
MYGIIYIVKKVVIDAIEKKNKEKQYTIPLSRICTGLL